MKKLLIISTIILAQNAYAASENKQRVGNEQGGMRITGYKTTKGVAGDLNGTYQMPTIAMRSGTNNNEEENMEEEDMAVEPENKRSTASIIRGNNGNDFDAYSNNSTEIRDNDDSQEYALDASEYATYDIE